jgi:hypothetical protein
VRLGRYADPLSASENSENNATGTPQQLLKASYSTPAMFRCSREARQVALGQYQLLYAGRAEMKPFYFNSNCDTIFVESVGTLSLLMSGPYKTVNGARENDPEVGGPEENKV